MEVEFIHSTDNIKLLLCAILETGDTLANKTAQNSFPHGVYAQSCLTAELESEVKLYDTSSEMVTTT